MQYLGLEGRAALVTGGSLDRRHLRGAGPGWRCGGRQLSLGRENADEVVQGIEAKGGRAIALGADVSDQDACRAMFKAFVERFSRLDILVANSGIQRDAAFTELTLSDWQRVLDVNLTGAFLCAQEAVRQFRDQPPLEGAKSRGNIIFISSVHQVIPWAGHANYATSKGGLKLLMETLAQEVAHEQIRSTPSLRAPSRPDK